MTYRNVGSNSIFNHRIGTRYDLKTKEYESRLKATTDFTHYTDDKTVQNGFFNDSIVQTKQQELIENSLPCRHS